MIWYRSSIQERPSPLGAKMGRGSPVCQQMHEQIIEMFKNNVSQRKIGRDLDIIPSTVHNIIQRFKKSGGISGHGNFQTVRDNTKQSDWPLPGKNTLICIGLHFPQLFSLTSPNVLVYVTIACHQHKLQFFSIANTHFLKACLVSSKLYTQIPKPPTQNAKPFIHPAKGNFAF